MLIWGISEPRERTNIGSKNVKNDEKMKKNQKCIKFISETISEQLVQINFIVLIGFGSRCSFETFWNRANKLI